MFHRKRIVAALLTVRSTSCSGSTSAPTLPAASTVQQSHQSRPLIGASQNDVGQSLPTPIKHVVIIIQENRTPDYLFQGIPGADISKYAVDSPGDRVRLRQISLSAPYDLSHTHKAFLRDFDNGEMDGFNAGMPEARALAPSDTPLNPRCALTTTWRGSTLSATTCSKETKGRAFPRTCIS